MRAVHHLDPALDPSWSEALGMVPGHLEKAWETVAERRRTQDVWPRSDRVLAALHLPAGEVRVVIVGQDPYPTPGHATGLAFSVPPGARPLPPTLRNILAEHAADLGRATPSPHGDLTPWSQRGVLLLNRVLTVTAGQAGSHRGLGWEEVTERLVGWLASRRPAPVFVLWGRDAQQLLPVVGEAPRVVAPHPSPLAAWRGFVGSRPFSTVNELLAVSGQRPVDWSLPT